MRNIIIINFSYEKKLVSNEKNVIADILTYTSKLLTNQKKKDQAEEALEALNRIIQDNGSLKYWVLGMCMRFTELLRASAEKKSAQYYRVVVYNDIIERSAATVMNGKEFSDRLDGYRTFKIDMSVFDET